MKMNTLACAAALALGLGGAALAQNDMPGTMTMPMSAPVSAGDRQYLIQDAQGSVADYANGAAALNQAQSPAVRQLGIWLLQDHNRLNIELLGLAQRKGVSVPLTISSTDKAKLTALTARTGADFDRQWLAEAIQTNRQDIQDAQKELRTTTDPEVRLVATDFLSTEYAHLTAAQTIQAGLGKNGR